MVNNLLYGITTALHAHFEYFPIYTDNVEQGLSEPCFFVMPVSATEQRLLGVRAFRDVTFDISFVSRFKREQLENVASEIYPLMRQITLLDGNKVNGLDLRHEIESGILHFFVRFKPTVRYAVEDTPMQESMDLNTEVTDK